MLDRLRSLGKSFTVYGLGDVATSIISFLLLPLYARFLTPEDYGAIGLLLSVEVVAKIVFRFGLDAAFMRLYFDCPDDRARQRLASTLFWFLAAVGGVVLVTAARPACRCSPRRWASPAIQGALRILLVNTFIIGFYFIPFHVLRMTNRPTTFVALTTSRSAATLLTRFALIIGFDLGVTGFVLADLIVSAVFTIVMLRWFAPLIRLVFSRAVLEDALRFGLPRVPHGLAAAGDVRRRSLRAAGLLGAERGRPLPDGRQLRHGAEAGAERVRVRVGAVLLPDDEGAGRQGDLPPGHDLRRRRPHAPRRRPGRRRPGDRALGDAAAVPWRGPHRAVDRPRASASTASTC